jgi:ATP-binding cassette, subfamily B, multidrug efflux pump
MIRLFKYISIFNWFLIFIFFGFVAGQVYLDILALDYIEELVAQTQQPTPDNQKIVSNGLIMLYITLGSMACVVFSSFFISYSSSKVSYEIRNKLFKKILDVSDFSDSSISISSLVNRTVNDTSKVQFYIAFSFQFIMRSIFTFIFVMLKIQNSNIWWTVATLSSVSIIVIVLSIILFFVNPLEIKKQKLLDDINVNSRDYLLGQRVVRSYNNLDYQNKSFDTINQDIFKKGFISETFSRALFIMASFFYNILLVSIYWIGAITILNEPLAGNNFSTFSEMVVFVGYSMQLLISFTLLTFVLAQYPSFVVSMKRIDEVMSISETLTYKDKNIDNIDYIEFKDVNFKYSSSVSNVLSNLNFKFYKGQVVSIIGSTGSGKSSIANLLSRTKDPTSGEILINGINLKDISYNSLVNNISYSTQRPVLFSGNLKDNIAYNDSLSSNNLNEVFISSHVNQFSDINNINEVMVNRSGTNFSGGQKQRISIARTIYKKSLLYIFDDSFSALDYKTESYVRSQVRNLTKDSIVFIIAQRISSVINSDKIIVLDKGQIVDIGNHNELLNRCDIYKQINDSQTKGIEYEE